MSTLIVKSPAKVNLFLHVTGKRPDGYHDLLSLMCCVSLYDHLELKPSAEPGIRIRCRDKGVPENDSNLAYKAADLFFSRLGCDPALPQDENRGGLTIRIEKNIPVAAGLGGGSSNAAAVLSALNKLYGFPFSAVDLRDMGLSLGADVPFFLFGSPAIAGGIGEKLKKYEKLKSYTILLVCFEFTVSTGWVYKNLNLRLTKCKKQLRNFLFGEAEFDVGRHLCNDLETVTAARHPEIQQAKKDLMALQARGALMSGSGPTVFGIYAGADKARNAREALAVDGVRKAFVADLLV
ncbi:MAG: 4-(cytidine 5'-diphospho)-2-C-methyl-D-erythritol kinase [Deltaproteobacteria bacterium]|nr:4-(cytidine 5'-diphospho)-2-C-methyl-D-erythritol kinase [Deltaproteobacteria bacterium]